jgi:hypothetical protein
VNPVSRKQSGLEHTYIALRATVETTARPNSILSGTSLLNWDTLAVR